MAQERATKTIAFYRVSDISFTASARRGIAIILVSHALSRETKLSHDSKTKSLHGSFESGMTY